MFKRSMVVILFVLMMANTAAAAVSRPAGKPGARAITTKQAAKQYLGDDRAFSTARTAFETAFAAWHSAKAPVAVTPSFVNPFVAACQTFERKLSSQRWPRSDAASVRQFVASVKTVANDVARLPSLNRLTGPAWASKLAADSAASAVSADELRSKLKLPAAT